jgi:chemotaxis protein CheX
MSITTNCTVCPDGLAAATGNVLSMLLEGCEDWAQDAGSDAVTAAIAIVGDHPAALLITCSQEFASVLASAMFGMDVADLADDEISDALGELANMVGGSVKAMLEGSWQLGLPTVSPGTGTGLVVPGGVPWCETQVDYLGHLVDLTFYAAEAHDNSAGFGKDHR